MSTEQKLMYGLDPSKYPSRMGQRWKDEEVIKLLTSIENKKTIEDIAKEHDRTVGGIRSYINKLATDYHFNNKMSIEEIQKVTGLSKEEIDDAVKRREYKQSLKKNSSEIKKKTKPILSKLETTDEYEPTIKEVVSMLKDIQEKLNMLLEKVA